MIVLGLDVATDCGWAVLNNGERVTSGCWNLDPKDANKPDHWRFNMLRRLLLDTCKCFAPDVLGYEHPRGLRMNAARVMYGLIGVVSALAYERGIRLVQLRPQEVKQVATGRGVATKFAMTDWAVRHFRFRDITGDDEADALAIALATFQGVA